MKRLLIIVLSLLTGGLATLVSMDGNMALEIPAGDLTEGKEVPIKLDGEKPHLFRGAITNLVFVKATGEEMVAPGGRLPLMTVRNIPQSTHITDRTGRVFPVKAEKDYALVLNCDTLDVVSSFDGFGVSIAEITLCDDPREAAQRFRRRESLTGGGYTNGLYKRGII